MGGGHIGGARIGGGHVGGARMGGGHVGGARIAGYRGSGRGYGAYGRGYGGYARGGYGGYARGYGGYARGYGGYGRGYGGYGYGYGRGWGGYGLYGLGGYGLGYGLGYRPSGYAYAPYYDTYDYSPDYYYSPDYSAAPIADYDAYNPAIVTPQSYTVPAAPAVPPDTTDRAKLHVLLPDPNAQVFIEGTLTQQTGTNREFITPPLAPDKPYAYTIRATWMENGHQMNRSMDVTVQAGRDTTADFRRPPNAQP